jgi:hypothetical protein
MEADPRDELGLLAWQWSIYPQGHRSHLNLGLHLATVPLFLLGTVAIVVSPLTSWLLAPLGLAGMLVAVIAQRRGHKSEVSPPRPFRSFFDFVARFFVEQWVTFPRYLASGALVRAWRSR